MSVKLIAGAKQLLLVYLGLTRRGKISPQGWKRARWRLTCVFTRIGDPLGVFLGATILPNERLIAQSLINGLFSHCPPGFATVIMNRIYVFSIWSWNCKPHGRSVTAETVLSILFKEAIAVVTSLLIGSDV